MSQIQFTTTRQSMWAAARQEVFRWQAYVQRLPLFLITMGLLYGAGVGLLRNASEVNWVLQVLLLIGYGVFYWSVFTLGRLIQGWWRARVARRARFRQVKERVTTLGFADGMLSLQEGRWSAQVPLNRIYSIYRTKSYLFIESPLLPWLPIARSTKAERFVELLNKRGKQQTPAPAGKSNELETSP